MKTKKILPCGVLYANTRQYWLLHPYPITSDSWEGDNTKRFVAVPRDDTRTVLAPARHVVTNSFTIDYMVGIPEIEVAVLDDLDLSQTEWFITES